MLARALIVLIGLMASSASLAQETLQAIAPGATVARSAAARAGDVVNVRDFGALGDGTTDDSAAINRAIAYARANLYGDGRQGFRLLIPQGRYLIAAPINLTMFDNRGVHVDARGAILIGQTNGKAVVDMMGTRWARVEGLSIYGESTRTPSIGIQIGRATTRNACSNGVWSNVTAHGQFSRAAVYIMSCETSKYYNLYAFNSYASPDSYALILDGLNHFNVPSDFVRGNVPVDMPHSFNEPNFFGLMVSADGGATPLWMANTARMTVMGGYLANTSGNLGAGPYSVSGNDAIKDLSLDLLMETNAIAYEFFLTGPNSRPTLDGFRYREQASNATENLFKTDKSITGVTMRGADIDLNAHQPRATLFSDPKLWTVSGRYRLPPGSAAWNLPDGNFAGVGITGGSARFVGDGSALSGVVASSPSTINTSAVRNQGSIASILLNTENSKHGGQYPLYLMDNRFPSITIQAPPPGGAQATASVSAMAQFGVRDRYTPDHSGWLPWTAGNGYHVNDVLTAVGGTYNTPFSVHVVAVDANGTITKISHGDSGSYTKAPLEPVVLSGGHGTGASLAHLTWNVLETVITAGGAGYTSPPFVTFAPGVGTSGPSTAAGTATLSNALLLSGGSATVALGTSGVAVAGGLSADTLHVVPATPASSHAACAAGQIAADANYVYVCAATNMWKRTALGDW